MLQTGLPASPYGRCYSSFGEQDAYQYARGDCLTGARPSTGNGQTGTLSLRYVREVSAMPVLEIPPHAWADFFDRFSRQHHGWLVSLDVIDLDSRRQLRAREVPLVGITAAQLTVQLGESGPCVR
jgi:Family of unknown function (DUF5335)